ncbi:MAG: amidohydrolase [Clostridia bacterium]|nr:amidohydrolase [Clostridia bacterium]
MDKKQAQKYIKSQKDVIIDINDRVWEYAETAFTEFKSAEKLCSVLESAGFEVERGVGKIETAFTARFGSGKPVIGLLAEYDALAGLNQKGGSALKEPTAPEDEGKPGHGCGHNCFGAAVVGAALGVKEYLSALPEGSGTVIVYGCPGEEGGSGKAFMAREGVFDGCDAALTWHPSSVSAVASGSSLANYQVLYKFYGVSSHAAADPEAGRSALDALELMNTGVQYLREHIPDAARIHYAITNTGGFSPNVVQARADVLYLIRSPKSAQVKELFERVNNIARGAALMTDTRVEIDFVKACSEIVKNEVLERVLYSNMEQVPMPEFTQEEMDFAGKMRASYENPWDLLEHAVRRCGESYRAQLEPLYAQGKNINDFLLPYYTNDTVSAGSTDVGDVTWICPTAQFDSVTTAAGTPNHSWQFASCNKTSIAHKGVLYAAQVLAGSVIDLLESPETLQKAKDEHKKRTNGEKYRCPIPEGVKPRPIDKL